jgi:hypothetical protein
MRDASAAPRNSRELAVRNQFFTPRYVVEFLTDNTLGRIWYEMTKGETRLNDQCRYLVRRPTEIFLGEEDQAPATPESDTAETLSQEELLNQPVYIPHRSIKDPREIRLLDPACGSMHFGLYAFDLFEAIYEESWDKGLCPTLQEAYPSKDDYLRDVPRLIIEHNIHGVDIDPRAVQIAGLSLWLRAQRTWEDTPASQRPRVRRSNIVCAEPMPGSDAMLEDFVKTLDPPLLGELVRTVFDKMQLAGEAGTLLKIEEEIRTAIDEARSEWEKLQSRHPELFSNEEIGGLSGQPELSNLDSALDASGSLLTGDFFDTAEERIYAALQNYAESAEAGNYQRRLFAEDAAHGFAFIDISRRPIDVVLMNPPFGESAKACREYFAVNYSDAASDIGMMFVKRFVEKLRDRGLLGAITNRTCLATSQLETWRREVMLGSSRSALIADLGFGVLDAAMVEACAYTVTNDKNVENLTGFRLIDSREKGIDLGDLVDAWNNTTADNRAQIGIHKEFRMLPLAVISYWAPAAMINKLTHRGRLGDSEPGSNDGGHTGDDYRFIRAVWEVPKGSIGIHKDYVFFAKGGEYSPMWDDVHLVELWKNGGHEIRQISGARIYHEDLHFLPGLTYPLRTTSDFSPRALPKQCMFSTGGHGIHFRDSKDSLIFLGYAYTRVAKVMVETLFGGGDASVSGSAARNYTAGTIKMLPVPKPPEENRDEVMETTSNLIAAERVGNRNNETTRYFVAPAFIDADISLNEGIKNSLLEDLKRWSEIAEQMALLEASSFNAFGIQKELVEPILDTVFGKHPCDYPNRDVSIELPNLLDKGLSALMDHAAQNRGIRNRSITKKSFFVDRTVDLLCHSLSTNPSSICSSWMVTGYVPIIFRIDAAESLINYLLGVSLGRWDIRYATDERQPPELPDPFDPLPVCPPGMLQNADGLPAAPADVPDDYPLRISWPGILVDDDGHYEDIVARVRDALSVLWGDRASAIEQEACDILGVRTLRDYFAEKKSGGKFFKDHLKRYSKSRRQAPIYWPLSTESGTYTLWIYYHRLDDQTLYSCVNNFVEPKLELTVNELSTLRSKSTRSSQEEKQLERLSDLEGELKDFRDELLRLAKFWKPNLNDGVQITAAPLWNLFRDKAWQKKLKQTWQSLEKGEYDWAHLAGSIWPERVLRKCHEDRSLAIAHGVEDDLWIEQKTYTKKGAKMEWKPKSLSDSEISTWIETKAAEMRR